MKMLNKIGSKLIVGVSITALIIIGIFSFISINSQSEILINEVERHGNQLSETIKKSLHDDMLANRRDRIRSIINTIGEEPSIKQVRIFNKEGFIIYSTHHEDMGKMLDKNAEACYKCHGKDQPIQRLEIEDRTRIYRFHPDSSRLLGIINPIYNEPSCWQADCHAHSSKQTVLGVLDITTSLESIDNQRTKSELLISVLAVISIVALGSIIAVFVKRVVDRPVKDLVAATNKVAVGNLNFRIDPRSKDELGELATSFNNMTKKLSEMRLQLFQSDKMASLGQLAAGVAHELNNPLTGVLTYSSFLLKRTKDNPELQNDLNVIVRETKRSREIVKELLDFARQSTPKKVKSDINQIIDRTERVVQNQLKIKQVNVEKKFEEKIPDLVVDPNQIQQVFLNLFVNSIDAIGDNGGSIKIATKLVSLSPYGLTRVRDAQCPNKHNLMDEEFKIDGHPTIKVKAKAASKEGIVHLDPIYGLHRHHYDFEFNKDENINLFCPECNVSLMNEEIKCPECNTATYRLIIPGKGWIDGCANVSGTWQKWEYMDQKGKQEYASIEFSDTGGGIPHEKIENIFDPFFSTKGQRGTGLGLSVVWGIIDNHNGRINVESEVGKGTTFTIKLPLNSNQFNNG